MSDIKLSKHLGQWRAERPSEWLMDEFINKAKALESRIEQLERERDALAAVIKQFEVAEGEELTQWIHRIQRIQQTSVSDVLAKRDLEQQIEALGWLLNNRISEVNDGEFEVILPDNVEKRIKQLHEQAEAQE